jgi:hypothetical protein
LQVPVSRIDLFNPQENGQLGSVTHAQTDLFRSILIGTAPITAAILAIWGLLTAFDAHLPVFAPAPQAVEVVTGSLGALLELFRQAGPLKGVAIFYLFFAIGNSVLLSPSDTRELKPFGILVASLAFIVGLLTQFLDFSKIAVLPAIAGMTAQGLNMALFLVLTVLLADLLVVLPLWVLYVYIYRRAYPA